MKQLMTRWIRVVVPVAGLVLSACTAVKVLQVDQSRQPEAKPAGCQLDVYIKQAPTRPHEVFGELEYVNHASSSFNGASTASGSRREAMEALNPKACELGADALLINEEDHDHVNMRVSLIHYTGA